MTNETRGNLLKIGGTVVGAAGSILGIVGAMVCCKKQQYTTISNNTEPAETTAPVTETISEVEAVKTTSEEKQQA